MTPLRLHATLLGTYVLVGLVVTGIDRPLFGGSFLNFSGVLPILYWSIAGVVTVGSSLALPFAKRKPGVVPVTHASAWMLAVFGYTFLVVHGHNEAVKADEKESARPVADASKCSRLESWGWEERPRGTVHLLLNVVLGAPSGDERLQVLSPDRLGDTAAQPLPEGPPGQHLVVEVVTPRIDPEPLDSLTISIPCPFAVLRYTTGTYYEGDKGIRVTRPLPLPTRSGAAKDVLRGYDLILFMYEDKPRFLLRPASNAKTPSVEQGEWRSVDALDATLAGLPPRQTIGFWILGGRSGVEDTSAMEATVSRRGHTIVKYGGLR